MKNKRVIALLLALVLALSLSACGKKAAAPEVELPQGSTEPATAGVESENGAAAETGSPASKPEKTVSAEHEHKFVIDAAVEPTCQETGLMEGVHCSECGEILMAQEIIPKIDHVFQFGRCIMCGETDPDYQEEGGGSSEHGGFGPIELPEIDF